MSVQLMGKVTVKSVRASQTGLAPAADGPAQHPANVGQNWSKKSNCRVFAQSHASRKLQSTSEYTWLANRCNKDFFSPFLFAFIANQTLNVEFTGKYIALDDLVYCRAS